MNTLYPEQQNAYNAFMDFLESPLGNFFLLEKLKINFFYYLLM